MEEKNGTTPHGKEATKNAPLKALALVMSLEGQRVEVIVERCGVSRKTVYRWTHEPNFVKAVDEANLDTKKRFKQQAIKAAEDALRSLVLIAANTDAPPQARIVAAVHVIEYAGVTLPGKETTDTEKARSDSHRELVRLCEQNPEVAAQTIRLANLVGVAVTP